MSKMILSIPKMKPRNPYALAARQRHGGAHDKSRKAVRRKERQRLKTCLDSLVLEEMTEFEMTMG